MLTYFDQEEYISNSDLTEFKETLRLGEYDTAGLQDIFDFGNLVDAMVTEPHKVDYAGMIVDSNGELLSFEAEAFKKAEMMKKAGDADPMLVPMFEQMKKQHEIYKKNFRIEWDGNEVFIPARCKFDGLSKRINMGADLKTTTCVNLKSFKAAMLFFNYDRQAAWYMDLAGIDRMMYIAISKNPVRGKHQVFKFAIQRGDEMYNSGKAKYSYLAFKYYFTVFSLSI